MKRKFINLGLSVLLLAPSVCWADFQYTETTKITGGLTAGLLKFTSKMGAASGPTTSTRYVKGNRMRIESGNGKAQIFDLDGHRMIVIDDKQKTYTVMTFDQMREQFNQMQQSRAQMNGKGQLNVSSKAQVVPTQNTRVILGQNTHEVQAKVDMQPADGSGGAAGGAMSYTSDMWVAPGVSGYQEISSFYQRLAQDAKWMPRGGASGDPRMAQAMAEMQKNSSALKGLPLLQTVQLTAAAPEGGANHAASTNKSDTSDVSGASGRNDAVTQAVGGLLGFGKRNEDAKADAQGASNGGSHVANSNSLMTATIEVTSFSSSAIAPSFFEIPAGYSQIQSETSKTTRSR